VLSVRTHPGGARIPWMVKGGTPGGRGSFLGLEDTSKLSHKNYRISALWSSFVTLRYCSIKSRYDMRTPWDGSLSARKRCHPLNANVGTGKRGARKTDPLQL
jgi:hypothetical protein